MREVKELQDPEDAGGVKNGEEGRPLVYREKKLITV